MNACNRAYAGSHMTFRGAGTPPGNEGCVFVPSAGAIGTADTGHHDVRLTGGAGIPHPGTPNWWHHPHRTSHSYHLEMAGLHAALGESA